MRVRDGGCGVRDIRVVHWGLGAMGTGMAHLVQLKPRLRSVGATTFAPAHPGQDLGDALGLERRLGVPIAPTFSEALPTDGADVVLIATGSFAADQEQDILDAITAGVNVITIAEEMTYPWRRNPELAARLDSAARKHRVTVLGTGINPGFVLDTLIIALTGVCGQVDAVRARRINDLSPFGPTVLRTQGVGTTPEEFQRGLEQGTIVGHVGFPESMAMIAAALGWTLDEIREERQPIISKTARSSPYTRIKPGQVAGCRHVARAYRGDKALIELDHPQQIHPEAEGIETGDYVWIDGSPPISLAIKPEIAGGAGTVAVAVNMIPAVVDAAPGLTDMSKLPIPRATMGDLRSVTR
ncbi:MAG: 2,4-diaminopentanoate dehydrogenase [Bacillota bacterium]|nr:2,4-diaminopentanoate dehydrogenase [Bacillota bacterium]